MNKNNNNWIKLDTCPPTFYPCLPSFWVPPTFSFCQLTSSLSQVPSKYYPHTGRPRERCRSHRPALEASTALQIVDPLCRLGSMIRCPVHKIGLKSDINTLQYTPQGTYYITIVVDSWYCCRNVAFCVCE